MTTVTSVLLVSAKGSPGVTTAACALTQVWPDAHPGRGVLLVDADPAGGDVAAGWLRGAADTTRGLLALASARGVDDPAAAVLAESLALDPSSSRLLLTGVSDPTRTPAVVPAWALVATALATLGDADPPVDVVIDAGRLGAATDPSVLRRAADLVVLVTGSSLPAAAAARAAAARLTAELGDRLRLVVVSSGRPYAAHEIADACGVAVLTELPWDPATARCFSTGAPLTRRAARSPYLRAVRAAAACVSAETRAGTDDRVVVLP